MKSFGKICVKCIIFLLIFVLLFLTAQEILRSKTENIEELKARHASYRNQAKEGMDIDVLFMGSSQMYAAAAPMTMFEEKGFTGMNMGTSLQGIMPLYYTLKDILEYSTPKTLVIDFKDIHEARMADDKNYVYSYRKVYDNIYSSEIKKEFVKEVIKETGTVEILFPIIYFHDRWDALVPWDFIPRSTANYVECTKGAYMCEKHEVFEPDGVYDETVESLEYDEFSLKYYKKLFELCKEKGIQIVALVPPTTTLNSTMAQQNTIGKICKEYDITCLNYNNPELFSEAGLDYATDFYNADHVNVSGSVKLSKSLAKYLDEYCDLPDHRGDEKYASWESQLEEYNKKYIMQGE